MASISSPERESSPATELELPLLDSEIFARKVLEDLQASKDKLVVTVEELESLVKDHVRPYQSRNEELESENARLRYSPMASQDQTEGAGGSWETEKAEIETRLKKSEEKLERIASLGLLGLDGDCENIPFSEEITSLLSQLMSVQGGETPLSGISADCNSFVAILRTLLSFVQSKESQYDDERSALQSENQAANSQLVDLRTKLGQSDSMFTDFEANIARLHSDLQSVRSEKTSLEARVARFEESRSSDSMKIQHITEENASLSGQLQAAKQELLESRSKASIPNVPDDTKKHALRIELETERGRHESTKSELELKKAQLAGSRTSASRAKEAAKKLEEENKQLQDNLLGLQLASNSRLERCMSQLDAAQKHCQSLETELSLLSTAYDESQAALKARSKEIDDLQEKQEKTVGLLRTETNSAQWWRSRHDMQETKLKVSERAVVDLRSQLTESQEGRSVLVGEIEEQRVLLERQTKRADDNGLKALAVLVSKVRLERRLRGVVKERDDLVQRYDAEVAQMGTELDAVRSQSEGISVVLKAAWEQLKTATKERDELSDQLQVLAREKDESSKKVAELLEQNKAADLRQKEMQSNIEAVARERKALEELVEQTNDELVARDDVISGLKEEHERALTAVRDELASTNTRLLAGQAQMDKIDELEASLSSALAEVEDLEVENDRLKSRCQTLENGAGDRNSAHEQELSSLRASVEELSSARSRLHARCDELEKLNSDLKQRDKRHKGQADRARELKSTVEKLGVELEAAKKRAGIDQNTVESVRKEMAEIVRAKEEREQRVIILEAEKAFLERTAGELSDEVTAVRNALALRDEQQPNQEAQNETVAADPDLQEQVANLEAFVNELLGHQETAIAEASQRETELVEARAGLAEREDALKKSERTADGYKESLVEMKRREVVSDGEVKKAWRDLEKKEQEVKRLGEEVASLSRTVRDLEKAADSTGQLTEALREKEGMVAKLEAHLAENLTWLNTSQSERDEQDSELSSLRNESGSLSAKLREVEADLAYAKASQKENMADRSKKVHQLKTLSERNEALEKDLSMLRGQESEGEIMKLREELDKSEEQIKKLVEEKMDLEEKPSRLEVDRARMRQPQHIDLTGDDSDSDDGLIADLLARNDEISAKLGQQSASYVILEAELASLREEVNRLESVGKEAKEKYESQKKASDEVEAKRQKVKKDFQDLWNSSRTVAGKAEDTIKQLKREVEKLRAGSAGQISSGPSPPRDRSHLPTPTTSPNASPVTPPPSASNIGGSSEWLRRPSIDISVPKDGDRFKGTQNDNASLSPTLSSTRSSTRQRKPTTKAVESPSYPMTRSSPRANGQSTPVKPLKRPNADSSPASDRPVKLRKLTALSRTGTSPVPSSPTSSRSTSPTPLSASPVIASRSRITRKKHRSHLQNEVMSDASGSGSSSGTGARSCRSRTPTPPPFSGTTSALQRLVESKNKQTKDERGSRRVDIPGNGSQKDRSSEARSRKKRKQI